MDYATSTIVGFLEGGQTNPLPEIECYIPKKNPSGVGLIVFPGGGYGGLARHEGMGYAQHFAAEGIACFVVLYRLGPDGFRHPAMLEDALAAMETVRARAEEFGVNPTKLGVMGSSAGGHLAAHSLVSHQKYTTSLSLRPDFGVLCYPVITSDSEYTHRGSMDNLVGKAANSTVLEEMSCEKLVTPETPPCFIWHTNEDSTVSVENSFLFAAALRRNKVPFELHVYENGEHGLGLNTPFDWAGKCSRWLLAR